MKIILSDFREKLVVTICEDIWNDPDARIAAGEDKDVRRGRIFKSGVRYHDNPLHAADKCEVDGIINLSASPFILGKQKLREDMLAAISKKYDVPLMYCNQVGGNDDLVFDGRSAVYSAKGELLARLKGFEEDVLVVDLDGKSSASGAIREDDFSREGEIWNALVCGTRDYVLKSNFSSVILGLSGGIDSALTAAVAVYALGAENVTGVLMPSPYSSEGSVDDSIDLAKLLGIATHTLAIEPIMQAFTATLDPVFAGREADVTEENIQSRIRGNLLMAMSNKFGAMLLTTGNKSELGVGYCTIYGDMAGGYAVLADVAKVDVFKVCEWLNEKYGPTIPVPVITKPPSAELRPDQKDEDSLPPYEILDEILRLHIEMRQSSREIIAAGFDADTVADVFRLLRSAEFKRRQAAPGVKITSQSFGTGWRMPLACKRSL